MSFTLNSERVLHFTNYKPKQSRLKEDDRAMVRTKLELGWPKSQITFVLFEFLWKGKGSFINVINILFLRHTIENIVHALIGVLRSSVY